MKLSKFLYVNGQELRLISHDIRLSLLSPGRAVFTVESKEPLKGLVVFKCGYSPEKVNTWFTGYIQTSTTVDAHQQRLFCRELSAVLYSPLPVALRSVTMKEVLAAVTERLGLGFELPQTDYTQTPVPVFYSLMNGYGLMHSLSRVFQYEKPIWIQKPDGQLFVGSWDDSLWATRPVQVPRSWEHQVLAQEGASIAALPALRPGVLYNDQVITTVNFNEAAMQLAWEKNPWRELSL